MRLQPQVLRTEVGVLPRTAREHVRAALGTLVGAELRAPTRDRVHLDLEQFADVYLRLEQALTEMRRGNV